MKEIRPKEDKAVSPIIATILLIAITVVLAATLVTILGGFTHGVSNTVETAGVTSHITKTDISFNVSSSSSNISLSSITITFTNAATGSSSSAWTSSALPTVTSTSLANAMKEANNTDKASGSSYFNGGSYFNIPIWAMHSVSTVSFELIYKGNVIYNSAA
jgi:flagellin-like protein